MDKLIDPLYDKAAEEADNKIIGTRVLLTRQYAPGSMDESVAVILDDLFQYGQDLDASGHGENEHDAWRAWRSGRWTSPRPMRSILTR